MYRGPRDPRYAELPTEPGWQSIAVCYGMLAATVLLLWAATNPLLGAATVTAVVGLGTRRLFALARCLSECGGFTLEVGETFQICVTRPSATDVC